MTTPQQPIPGNTPRDPSTTTDTDDWAVSTPPPAPGSASGSEPDGTTTDAAKGEGKQVAQEAKEGGQHVAGVAQEEAGKVASSAGDQAKSLLGQGKTELSEQVGTQQQRLAEVVRSLGQELGSMAEGSEQSGPATDLVRQASQRTDGIAGWLEGHEPADALDEVRRFARRRPGTFILMAAGAGLLAGRLTRGLTADSEDGETSPAPTEGRHADPTPAVGTPAPVAHVPPAPVGAGPVPPVGAPPSVADDAAGYPDDGQGAGRPAFPGPGPR